jgi:carbohydrate-binding DOMON domain-containing protein
MAGTKIKIPNDLTTNERAAFGCMNETVNRLQAITSFHPSAGTILVLPNYSTADRPTDLTSTDAGVIIFNTTTSLINVWTGTGWTLTDGTPV